MTAPDLIIRRATPADAVGMLHAHRRAVQAKGSTFYTVEQLAAWSPAATQERIERQEQELSDKGVVAYVAELDKVIVGLSIFLPDTGELRAAYTAPAPQKGIGSKLLERILTEAHKIGVVELACDSSLNAENFYRKHGFEAVERTLHRLNNDVEIPCVKMIKRLQLNTAKI